MQSKKHGYWYVLHLTPNEIFVWKKLRSLAKQIDNQLRVAIPAEHDVLYLEWDPGDLVKDEHELAQIVQKFCSAGIIARLGDSEKGKVPYVFADDPTAFFINPIQERPAVTATPEFVALALKIMQGKFEENSQSFQPHLQQWIAHNSELNPGSVYVKMVGVRIAGSPAIGVFFKNPNWQPGHATEKRRYLIAAPGFLAFSLISQSKEQLKEKRKQRIVEAQAKRVSQSPPEPNPEQFLQQSLEELETAVSGIEVDIAELKKMLALKEKEFAVAKSALAQKLDERLVVVANEQRLLQARRDQLKPAK